MARPGFQTPLRFEDVGGLPYTLTEPLVYQSAHLFGDPIIVPAGFHTDLATIPRALWIVLPKSGRYDAPATLHDYLYASGGFWASKPSGVRWWQSLTRGQADALLLEAMDLVGVGLFTRHVIYAAVRVGGWPKWQTYRQAGSR